MTDHTQLVTLVSRTLSEALKRGDDVITIICEELGSRLVAEEEHKDEHKPNGNGCEVCAQRAEAKRAAQRKWRKARKGKKNGD